ncbi:hypothetical protein [Moorena bouillonii]|uniref:hypothetical protein n=1 Tax=Moorena bouillonii TaxID=207920 RepID=UPI00117DAEAA|nr:hypothetical protein [Moorena bouillonii]NEO50485.1 hypothetical protein [Moorena sp. SIO4A3]
MLTTHTGSPNTRIGQAEQGELGSGFPSKLRKSYNKRKQERSRSGGRRPRYANGFAESHLHQSTAAD